MTATGSSIQRYSGGPVSGKRNFQRGIVVGASLLSGLLLLTSSVFAQTVPPGGAAPLPVWPSSPVAPPATAIPSSMSDDPVQNVTVAFFGPSSVVSEFLVPRLVTSTAPVGCYSGPNATTAERDDATLFGTKPAGSQFIAFFVRGTRTYVYDTSVGNYCWIDNNYSS